MENETLVTLETVCTHYKVETSFIKSLDEFGLVSITRVDEIECLDKEALGDLEGFINLHYELNVNLEGLDVINHLLKRVKEMKKEMVLLHNRLEGEKFH